MCDEYLLFTSISGIPLNFKLLCGYTKKTHYTSLIRKHGGTVIRSVPSNKSILLGESLPCEQGHRSCHEHPSFTSQPVFKLNWVDDCINEREVLDCRVYILNPSPAFARINYMDRFWKVSSNPMSASDPSDVSVEPLADPVIPISFNVGRVNEATSLPPTNQCIDLSSYNHESNKRPQRPHRSLTPLSTRSLPRPNDGSDSSESSSEDSLRVKLKKTIPDKVDHTDRNRRTDLVSYGVASVKNNQKREERLQQPQHAFSSRFPPCPNDGSASSSDSSLDCFIPSEQNKKTVKPLQMSTNAFRPTPSTSKELTTKKPKSSKIAITLDSSDSDSSAGPKKLEILRSKSRSKVTENESSELHRIFDDGSFDGFGPPPGAIVRRVDRRQNTRASYTVNEEKAILKYILASKRLYGLRSNFLWKKMDGTPGLESRTWQSLREHFLKKMLGKLEVYGMLTENQITTMRNVHGQ